MAHRQKANVRPSHLKNVASSPDERLLLPLNKSKGLNTFIALYTAETAISFKEKFIQLTALPFALLVHRALGFSGPSMPY